LRLSLREDLLLFAVIFAFAPRHFVFHNSPLRVTQKFLLFFFSVFDSAINEPMKALTMERKQK